MGVRKKVGDGKDRIFDGGEARGNSSNPELRYPKEGIFCVVFFFPDVYLCWSRGEIVHEGSWFGWTSHML